jgi:hypothetical protein
VKLDIDVRDDTTGIDARAARLRVAPNVLEALKRYTADTRVLSESGELMRYGDGRPVVLDVVAAFHILCDAEDRARLDASARPHGEVTG